MPPGTRAANRAAMESEILRLGRAHLQTHGAAALSLRAIARELGVVSSAVYRYVPSRDDLLTALVVEAYTELADAAEAAHRDAAAGHPARLLAIARAVRTWAVDNPARWALLYGSPVPGYAAPAELTTGPGTRVIALILGEFRSAQDTGALTTDRPVAGGELTADFDGVRTEFDETLTDRAILGAVSLFASIVGATSLEVFGQYGADGLARPELLFSTQIEAALSTALA